MTKQELERYAGLARSILEQEGALIWEHFTRFPKGCCGESCDILGTWFINELKFPDVVYVAGAIPNAQGSHAWLKCNGYIVDITSDQFEDGCGPVFVGAYSDFHSKYLTRESIPVLNKFKPYRYEDFSSRMNEACFG